MNTSFRLNSHLKAFVGRFHLNQFIRRLSYLRYAFSCAIAIGGSVLQPFFLLKINADNWEAPTNTAAWFLTKSFWIAALMNSFYHIFYIQHIKIYLNSLIYWIDKRKNKQSIWFNLKSKLFQSINLAIGWTHPYKHRRYTWVWIFTQSHGINISLRRWLLLFILFLRLASLKQHYVTSLTNCNLNSF